MTPSSAYPLAPEKSYFYGGNITSHFGHFLTETLPRYWCYRERYDGMKILVHAEKTLEMLFGLGWLSGFFALLDLTRDDFVVFERPTLLHQLIIAGTSFEENHFAHHAFARFCNELGEKRGIRIAGGRPVFLSRAAYPSQMRSIRGERAMIPLLEQEGIAIVEPETLSIPEQIGLFSGQRPTLGFVGSAFHNSIFCARPIGVALTCDGLVSSNFVLMDRANHARIRYLTTPGIVSEPSAPGQPARYRIENPHHVVRHLLEAVQSRIWTQQAPPAPPASVDGASFLLRTFHGTWMMIDRQWGVVAHGAGEGDRAMRLILRLDQEGWAILTTPTGDCLTMEPQQQQGPILSYRYRRFPDGTIALHSHDTERFVCATPDGGVLCDRSTPSDWEKLTLIPLP
ncbi:glycosyltransferase family 61 protein [Asaia krungthepensis]|uniref:Glycosyltransferase 61 catalytic domain-containing protein n=1 Tax=Asaia krungthepensis NRIC 0535 TaxID=1307925 RepID=A0ABQ0Q3D3_9PROT|nr:glycosyltransferase family 61 protein [Asaia krungthepensis]GBQ89326.1 hypothetical protein AA0535_1767 [Asaia krungthepensis NRIC 0535]